MKKIALDLDGVVFDSENLYRVYAEIYDVDFHKEDTLIDNSQRLFQNRYSWSKEESQKFYNEYADKILKSANIMTGADIVLNKLKDNFEFIVVTSRNDYETEIAKARFQELGIENIKIFNNEHHKIDRLIEEDVDYLIDDDEKICINASNNNVCALYFKNSASNRIEKYNVVNVNNWGEIYKYLMLSEEK